MTLIAVQNPLGTSNMWEVLNVSLGMDSFCLSAAYSKGIVHSKHMTQYKTVCASAFAFSLLTVFAY